MNGRKKCLLLLAEECGEVTKEAVRTALKKNKTRTRLTDEVAQVLALVEVLIEDGQIDSARLMATFKQEHKRYEEIING